jgi:predicted dehydrogenase
VKILIVGLGSIGLRHLAISRSLFPSNQIKSIGARVFDKWVREENKIKSEFDKEISDFAPDIVAICSPSPSHISIAQFFVERGANLFIEKPISNDIYNLVKFIEKCSSSNRLLMVGYNLRYLNSLQEFRRHINEGLIGNPLSVRCEVGQYLPNWRQVEDYRESVTARSDLGGGVLLELSHEIDYLRWIFGEVDWVRATLLRQSELEIDVEDTVHMNIGFETITNGRQLIANLNMDFIRHDTTRRCTVIGDMGSIRWDGISGEVSLFQAGRKTWETLFANDNGIEETYILEWQELISAIEGKRSPAVTGEDGLRVVEIIEAARLSSKSGIQTAVVRSPIKSEASR